MTDQPTPAQLREAADILAAACDDRDVNWATPDDLREWAQRQEEEAARGGVPTCSLCRRQRTVADAYDYNPLQVITGQPVGWYSGGDGEVCPQCMAKTLNGQR